MKCELVTKPHPNNYKQDGASQTIDLHSFFFNWFEHKLQVKLVRSCVDCNCVNRPPDKHVLNVITLLLDENLIYLCLSGLNIRYSPICVWPTVIHRGEQTLQVMNNSINKKATFKSMRLPNQMATRLWTYRLNGWLVIGFGIKISFLISRAEVVLYNLTFKRMSDHKYSEKYWNANDGYSCS